jgi:hypothetical protein
MVSRLRAALKILNSKYQICIGCDLLLVFLPIVFDKDVSKIARQG